MRGSTRLPVSAGNQPMREFVNDRRRSRRLPAQIPIVIKGTDARGRTFFDRGAIILVDAHGARMRARFQLKVGAEIQVQLPNEETLSRMRVAWRGDVASFEEGLVGAELADTNETWDAEALAAR